MPRRTRATLYSIFVIALWGGILPGILIRDQAGQFDLPLREPWFVAVALLLLFVGTALVHYPALQLADAGVTPFGVVPGPVLVTDGWYGRVRNPMDLGATLIALASWAAFDVPLMWVVPAAALLTFIVGSGLYEDVRLKETFAEEYEAYRDRVPKWWFWMVDPD